MRDLILRMLVGAVLCAGAGGKETNGHVGGEGEGLVNGNSSHSNLPQVIRDLLQRFEKQTEAFAAKYTHPPTVSRLILLVITISILLSLSFCIFQSLSLSVSFKVSLPLSFSLSLFLSILVSFFPFTFVSHCLSITKNLT